LAVINLGKNYQYSSLERTRPQIKLPLSQGHRRKDRGVGFGNRGRGGKRNRHLPARKTTENLLTDIGPQQYLKKEGRKKGGEETFKRGGESDFFRNHPLRGRKE